MLCAMDAKLERPQLLAIWRITLLLEPAHGPFVVKAAALHC